MLQNSAEFSKLLLPVNSKISSKSEFLITKEFSLFTKACRITIHVLHIENIKSEISL